MVWPSDIISIILAVAFGAAIGMEREISGKAAGLRTNVLICIGAAIFTIISKKMGGEPARIAAGVVAGVGFLGAGAVIQDRGGVRGLTTAASIWLVSSIGMACGAGFYSLAATSTLIGVLILIGLGQIERPLGRYGRKHKPKSFFDDQDKN
ncbi:MAG: MgtC/SapB family protein [Planctomycetota bacterium]|nr:MAG: MgtC/SapB family protein [Planctomycetota bacterium]